jgi:hypothetical protein
LIDTLLAVKQFLSYALEFLGHEVRVGRADALRVLRVLAAERDEP